ncbi:MAG: maleylpyruvate isomerase N-terminal domain-containing protein, partial [Anaerolineae bacterium]|nr:maleylpyruvate isomerase N-terminal domain-containing protein [Anaerolineae bacterium]
MNPSDILKYGDSFLVKILDGVPQSEWEKGGVCGVWSVKDIMGHLASYEHWLQEVLAPFAGVEIEKKVFALMGEVGPVRWNDVEVENRRGTSIADVLKDYANTFQHTQEHLVPRIPSETWSKVGTIPWYGADYSLDDFVVYAFY